VKPVILAWFRQDLRIADNPMLAEAGQSGCSILPVYIHDPKAAGQWAPGGASKWWLHHALQSLQKELQKTGLPFIIRSGDSLAQLEEIIADLDDNGHAVEAVLAGRRYEPAAVEQDTAISDALAKNDIRFDSFNSSLLIEPERVQNQSGQPFQVYTPFWKHLRTLDLQPPVKVESSRLTAPNHVPPGVEIDELSLLPDIGWDKAFPQVWNPTLAGASESLTTFVEDAVGRYRDQRDLPGVEGTSRLSPYLHFGQLSPRQVWALVHAEGKQDGAGGQTFLKEVVWREFAFHLLHHYPDSPEVALKEAYRDFPWQPDESLLKAWQQGKTGYPLVDAGMRQLWKTGWMHNRVRMVAGSFLVKHLLQPWQDGAAWFWDTLVDADLASNTMGWQWVAGSGADAAPYFRIFNPILQSQKFDTKGKYIRRFVPELVDLPDEFIHQPWEAPDEVLQQANVRLGDNYPEPLIEHSRGRERALEALQANKKR